MGLTRRAQRRLGRDGVLGGCRLRPRWKDIQDEIVARVRIFQDDLNIEQIIVLPKLDRTRGVLEIQSLRGIGGPTTKSLEEHPLLHVLEQYSHGFDTGKAHTNGPAQTPIEAPAWLVSK